MNKWKLSDRLVAVQAVDILNQLHVIAKFRVAAVSWLWPAKAALAISFGLKGPALIPWAWLHPESESRPTV